MREKSNYIIIYYVTIDQYYLGDTYELSYIFNWAILLYSLKFQNKRPVSNTTHQNV